MSKLADLEAERLREQARLDAERDQLARNKDGQFATPPALAVDIVAAAVAFLPDDEPIRFLEPSVGSGSFVSALLAHPAADRIERMLGLETDPRFAAVAARVWGTSGLCVRADDFTTSPPDRFNLLVANPPYVRHHHLDRNAKQRLQRKSSAVAGTQVSGLAGLYAHFLLHADAWLAPGGVAAWLIPSEFLDVNYGRAVRCYLSRNVELLRVHRFCASSVQFDDALVSSTVVIYRKCAPSGGPVLFTSGPELSRPDRSERVSRTRLDPAAKWRPLFGNEPVSPAKGLRLGDLFSVRRGLATGANDFFIMPRAEAVTRGLPPEFLKPILPSPRHLTGDVIDTTNEGFPKGLPELVLLDCRLSEREISTSYPALWKYLQGGVHSGVASGYLCSSRTPWYAQEDRPPAPFVVPYMGRGRAGSTPFRFIRNRSRATAANVYLMLYPRGPLVHRLTDDPRSLDTVHAALTRIGGSAVADGGRVYGGGLHKVEPKELSALSAEPVLELLGADGNADNLFAGFDPTAGATA